MNHAASAHGEWHGPGQKTRSSKSEKIFWFFVLVLSLDLFSTIEDEEEVEDDQPSVGGSLR
jgi:hypothetical protein